jgi:hypothetical protein
MALLSQARETASYAEIGRRLGYSRSAISTLHAGKYPGDPTRICAAVRAGLAVLICPHLQAQIDTAACLGWRTRAYPASSSVEAAHWRACRKCTAYQQQQETAHAENESSSD